jgi:hypothetical protein
MNYQKQHYKDVAWAVSSKGYINKKVWMQVLQYIVAWKKPTADDPIIVIADNHSTRYDIDALEWAKEHHCHVFTLPPNCTCVTQPLDISVYGPFKQYIREEFDYMMSNGIPITRATLPSIIISAWNKAATISNIKSGWKRAAMGIFDKDMNTFSMTSDKFTPEAGTAPIITSSSTTTTTTTSSNEVKSNQWKAPPDLQRILRPRLRVEPPTKPSNYIIQSHT